MTIPNMRLSERIAMLNHDDKLKKKLEVKNLDELEQARWETQRPWLYYKRTERQVKDKGPKGQNTLNHLKMWGKVIS